MTIKHNKFSSLNDHSVAILDAETNTLIEEVSVFDVCSGSGCWVELEDDTFYLYDDEEAPPQFLGDTLKEALDTLNTYIEYFNGEDWYSDFTYYFQKG